LYIGFGLSKKESLAKWAWICLLSGMIAHFFSVTGRTVEFWQIPQNRWFLPLASMFDTLSFFVLIIIAEYIFIQSRQHMAVLGAFVVSMATLVMLVGFFGPSKTSVEPLPEKLQSYSLTIHVPLILMAYAAFAIAFAVGLVFLIQERQIKSKKPSFLVFNLPSLDELDTMIFHIILFALPLLGLGILNGAHWAQVAWGRYWDWDPKETWALITFLVYLGYVSARLIGGWRGRKATYLSLIGFFVVIFTYVGVDHLSKLHTFKSGGP
jgi:cytochrome c-type biogenesis protein CcsB